MSCPVVLLLHQPRRLLALRTIDRSLEVFVGRVSRLTMMGAPVKVTHTHHSPHYALYIDSSHSLDVSRPPSTSNFDLRNSRFLRARLGDLTPPHSHLVKAPRDT